MKPRPEPIPLSRAPAAGAARAGALAVMSRAVLAVLECPDVESAAVHILEACRRLVGPRLGRLAMLDGDAPGRWVGRLGTAGPALSQPPGSSRPVPGLAALAARVGAGRIQNGRRGAADRLPLPRPCGGWESVLAVPLATGGHSEGLLLLGNKPGGFTRRDLLVASTFGSLAGAAHQRCLAGEQLARRVREASAAAERSNRELRRQVRSTEEVRRFLAREHAFRVAVENSVTTGISASDAEGRIVHVNRAFCRIVGWRAAELVGRRPPHPFWPPGRRAEYLASFRDLGTGRPPPGGYRVQFRRRSGELFDAQVMVAPLRSSEGGWVVSLSDVTKELRTEADLRRAAEQLRVVSARLIEAEERERKRIARELHDSLGQTLTALRLRLEGTLAECRLPHCGGSARRGIADALAILTGATDEVRNAVADLRPTILDDLGLASAITWFCREFGRLHPGIRCTAAVRLGGAAVPEHLGTTVFRLVQEGLTNVLKHSGADRARVRLAVRRGRLELVVDDNGRGFRAGRGTGGFGLAGMRERAELAGGAFAVASTPGHGTVVRATWPLPPAAG